jgi:rod shape-determining protein MreC
LEVICVLLITKTNTTQGNDIVSSANAVTGSLYKKQSDVMYYFGLRRMNDSLVNENARLRAQIALYRTVDTLRDTNVRRIISTDTLTHIVKYADYLYHSARVINNSVTAENNFITIDIGSRNGVRSGMAVISGSGAVGKVVHVSAHYASVISILSERQPVSAKLKEGTFGLVIWKDNPDVLVMKDVAQQIRVKPGDSVFTTSYSLFPADVLIGTVFKIEAIKKNGQQLLYLRPATNFRNLQYVYVVENKMADERKKLEDSTGAKP